MSLRIAIVVIDANEAAFDNVARLGLQSPAVHPAIQALFDALATDGAHEYFVLYGARNLRQPRVRSNGKVTYVGVPAPKIHIPGMGAGYWSRFLALRRFIRRELKPDLVHAQGTERESGMVAVHSGLPNLITMHGNFRELRKFYPAPIGSYLWTNALLENHVLRRVGGIICISNYVRGITAGYRKPQYLIPNPVRPEFLTAKRPEWEGRNLCFMGALDQRKRPEFVLQACIPLWRKGMEFRLHFYGRPTGTHAERLKQIAADWVQRGSVVFEGFTADPLQAMLASDVMVSASVEESFGMNVLEAMAAGTVVVAPRTGGICDIVKDGQSGFLFDVEDLANCTAHIQRLLTDRSCWNQVSEAGRHLAMTEFSPTRISALTDAAYSGHMSAKG